MEKGKKVQLNLYLPIQYRDLLRRIAAERSLKNPGQVFTAAGIVKEIICEWLSKMELNGKQE